MIPLELIPPLADRVTQPCRLRLKPHDGTETPDSLAQERAETHGSMTLADGSTPVRIITSGTAAPQSTKAHLFTTAPVITTRQRDVVFAGTYPANITRPKKSRPPANYVRTPSLPQHLRDWAFLGTPVCTLNGSVKDAERNLAEHLLRHRMPTELRISLLNMCYWPLDPRSMEILNPENWAQDMPVDHPARFMLLTTVASMCWLQTWGLIMGRFMYQTDRHRQTWPLLLRHHELRCKLYETARVVEDRYMRSAEVERCFPTFTRLNAMLPRPVWVSERDMASHRQEWLAFLVSHSFSDALFAWLFMNANEKRAFQICDDLRRKIHQLWLTRHFVPHTWSTEDFKESQRTAYAVIQGLPAPRVKLPTNKTASPFDVIAFSHPVVRPGMPLFAVQMLSLQSFAQPAVQELYGARAFIEPLHLVWDLSMCMTVADQRTFYRALFAPNGGGLFDTLIRAVCRDVNNSNSTGVTRATPLRTQMDKAARQRKRYVGLRNTSLAHVLGLPMSRRGPRDAGVVIQLETHSALEHVSDGRPLSFRGHGTLAGMAKCLGCEDVLSPVSESASGGPKVLWCNSQSFYAPNHEVDLARFMLYLRPLLQSELYRVKLLRILQRGRVHECVKQHPKHQLDLGLAYYSISLHHANASANDVPCEFDVWAALLAFHLSGLQARLPETPEELCDALPSFWTALNAHWYRYMRRVDRAVTKFLLDSLHSTTNLNSRRDRFNAWQAAEACASTHRMARLAAGDLETQTLWQCVTAFGAPPAMRWLLFFFLTHVQQPVPLDPAYFVQPTSETELKIIRDVSAVSVLSSATSSGGGSGGRDDIENNTPLSQLQHAVAHALLFSGVLWTSEVNTAWRRYKYSSVSANGTASDKSTMPSSPESDARALVDTILPTAPSELLELSVKQFVIRHTVAVFAKVDTELPRGECVEIDDLLLSQYLTDAESPDYTIFLHTETRADAVVCECVYLRTFGTARTFQFVQASLNATTFRCPGDATTVWKPAMPDWTSRVIVTRSI